MTTEIKKNVYYKITNPDGTSFYDRKTKYVAGKTVRKEQVAYPVLCSSSVIHASPTIKDALRYARNPLAIHRVEGDPVVSDDTKSGFFSLKVIDTLPESQYDDLLGFRYHEACNPINPMLITNDVSGEDIASLRKWASVRASVRDSVWDSVWDSVRASVRDSVWDSVWASVRASVRASVWDSVWDSVWASVWASVRDTVRAYIGSLFPGVDTWKYVDQDPGTYPFQPAVDLWKRGFVPVRIGRKWHLYGWRNGKAVSLYAEAGF